MCWKDNVLRHFSGFLKSKHYYGFLKKALAHNELAWYFVVFGSKKIAYQCQMTDALFKRVLQWR